MSEETPLTELAIDRRCFEFLRSLGLRTVGDLVAIDPPRLAARPAMARQIAETLRTAYPDFCQAILTPREERAEPGTPLEHALAILKRRGEPITFRRLREEVLQACAVRNLVTLNRELREHPDVIFYPFGSHQWLGWRPLGEQGIREAARAAWLVLPVHLESLLRQGRTEEVSPEVLSVLEAMAEEKNHRDLLRLLASWSRPEPIETTAPTPIAREAPPAYDAAGLLQGLSFSAPITDLAAPIARALATINGARSLCQVKATANDLEWLRGWAAKLSSQNVSIWLEGTNPCFEVGQRIASQRECFGLLVMLLACEVCRRESSEGHVWTEICPCFSSGSRSVLFSQGHARAPLAQALEAACRRFQLHHAFGLDGVQAWYQSFYLQFGFTRSGIQKLPSWLSVDESQSVAVTALRQDSPEFSRLWQALSRYRDARSPQAREQLTRVLEDNPYVLPEWRGELLRAALEAIPQHTLSDIGEDIAYPLLRWPVGGHPTFVISPTRAFQDLVDRAYTLFHDDEPIARLYREPEGYLSDPGEVSFRPRHDRIHLTLTGEGGEDVRELELLLWDSEALFSAYHLSTGERLDAPHPGQPCALLLSEGIELEPPAPQTAACGKTGYRLHQLPSGLTPQHRMLLDGQELGSLAEPRLPAWTSEIRIAFRQDEPARLPCRVMVDLMAPAGVRVRWARFGRQNVPMQELAGIGWRGSLQLEPDLATPRVRMHFGLEYQSQRARVSCAETVRINSVTTWSDGVWRVLDRLPHLLVSDAREGSFRFFIENNAHREFGLIEGDVFSTRPRQGTRSLGRLAGFGSELRLARGPYNSPAEGRLLVSEVVDRGLIQQIETGPEGFKLRFHRPVDGDEDNFVVWWDGLGSPVLQPAAELDCTEGSCWSGPVPPGAATSCVGFGYDGVRLGSWWESSLSLPDEARHPAQFAGLVRWLHLPVLRSSWLASIRRLAHRHPVDFMQAWLASDSVAGLPQLRYEAELSEWFAVVREVFRGWNPGEDTVVARSVFNRVGLDALLRVSPILLVRLARAAWNDERLAELQLELVGAPRPRLPAELQFLEETAAREMRVQDTNVRGLIRRVQDILRGRGNALDRREQLNLGLAMGVAPFRRALAARLLD